jgi:hypothetical protein
MAFAESGNGKSIALVPDERDQNHWNQNKQS